MEPFETHERQLRDAYIRATPRQRLEVALQRVRFPDCGPNRLIQVVSAVEGLARSLVVNARVAKGETASGAYASVRNANATALVGEALSLHGRPGPAEVFGKEAWATFQHAVKYRNLLVHECTFLRQGYSDRLIGVASGVFGYLAAIAEPGDAAETERSG